MTIDVQRDFTLPGAPAEIPGTAAAVPNMVRLVEGFRTAGRPIAHMIRLYKADGSSVDLCRREKIVSGWEAVRPGSAGAELMPELGAREFDADVLLSGEPQQVRAREWILYKPRWGAFYQTALERMIAELDIDTVVVCGCNFPNCPRTSIYEASERDLRVMLVDDAMSGVYDQGRREMENIGVAVASTDACLDWLRG
ncbi:MAG: isochorismatase family cysteine hydrolase [Acidobacteriota bacterium]